MADRDKPNKLPDDAEGIAHYAEQQRLGHGRIEFDELGNAVWVPNSGAQGDDVMRRLLDDPTLAFSNEYSPGTVKKIQEIQKAVTIPVMAKARIGHFVEAQILEALGVDYIDESEVLTPADDQFHISKHPFKVPFVCGWERWRASMSSTARMHSGSGIGGEHRLPQVQAF